MDDDDIVDGEVVDDPSDDGADSGNIPVPFAPPETILTPCHHGCTCGLHQQVVYGERVEKHAPEVLDHGEMGLLVQAVGDVAHLLHGFHDYFRKLRATATTTHGNAQRALRDLALALDGDELCKARSALELVEETYADLTPEQRQPTPRWLKAAMYLAVGGMVVFDAYFFQQIFLNILQVSPNDSWWKHDIGLIAAVVMAIGLIAAGRILAGPIWRAGRRWRRAASPDDPPPRRIVRVARAMAIGVAPAVTFFILGFWASLRGQAAVAAQRAALNPGTTVVSVIPSGFAVMLLLLSLGLTVLVLEVLVYNPYQADIKRAGQGLAEVREKITASRNAAAEALDAHEIAWRDLRSARDEVISFVHAELARPWQTVILPARLRHGRAGPRSAQTKYGVSIELPSIGHANGTAITDQVTITYQIFDGMPQPQPGPGPLAEVVRAVLELDPERLRERQRSIETAVHQQLGDEYGQET